MGALADSVLLPGRGYNPLLAHSAPYPIGFNRL